MERNTHLQVVACLGVLSTQCAVQQIFAIACLKSGIQRFNDYSSPSSIGAVFDSFLTSVGLTKFSSFACFSFWEDKRFLVGNVVDWLSLLLSPRWQFVSFFIHLHPVPWPRIRLHSARLLISLFHAWNRILSLRETVLHRWRVSCRWTSHWTSRTSDDRCFASISRNYATMRSKCCRCQSLHVNTRSSLFPSLAEQRTISSVPSGMVSVWSFSCYKSASSRVTTGNTSSLNFALKRDWRAKAQFSSIKYRVSASKKIVNVKNRLFPRSREV